MVNSTATPRGAFSLVLSTPITYLATLALAAFALVGAYVFTIFPTIVGQVGVTAGILGLVAFLIQDLMSEKIPTGWPTYTTFIGVSVVGAIEAGIGHVTGATFVTLAAFLGWLLYVIQAFVAYLNQDAGANIPLQQETMLIAVIGFVVTILASISTGGSLGVASISAAPFTAGMAVTGVATSSGFLFAKETAMVRARAAKASAQ